MSNFGFLRPEWPDLFDAASRAESLAGPDPRAACFYARRALELAVAWMYRSDAELRLPYQEHLSALLHEPSFKTLVGQTVLTKAKLIKDLGNLAVHSSRPVLPADSLRAVTELFHVCYWLAHTYARGARPDPELRFRAALLPRESAAPPATVRELEAMQASLAEKDAKLSELLTGRAALDAELARLREEVARARQAAEAQPDPHDYSEAETRSYFIDLLLREAGWALDAKRDREFPVQGMPNAKGEGFVDYVLWGDDGKPLGLVEAKRATRDARAGQQQAKLYADCLERMYGQRPVIFYSNGYEHWLWDDAGYPPRPVQGFYAKDELDLLIRRRAARRPLSTATIDQNIVNRHYQNRAIRKVCEAFERDNERKALVVMATGAGKTRTVIALCDVLLRCNWAKRVLFLADRIALVNQAVGAFKKHLPGVSPVNLVTDKTAQGRVYVSTYPTMMGLIDETHDGRRRFGPGHFDLVIIDEAHRSVFRKYKAIFDYFDSLLVGLTATPKDEVDRNTYGLFDLETGAPTDAYGLEEAVKDGYLAPPRAVSVPLKFQRQGIRYDDLSEEDREEWDALEWGEGEMPDRVEAEAVNKWLFNADTVDKVLETLMTQGLRVAGGDRLGKTIVFAKNHAHAEFIVERFNASYPEHKGKFARVVDYSVEYAQSLIDDFSIVEKAPHIAVSVDMLDTGIDVPEALNLVFFKLVRSKTKFWQMLGRGTRLCPDLFGPGMDKTHFLIFDFCQNLEYFSQNPETAEGSGGDSLGKKLFGARLELIATLDKATAEGDSDAAAKALRELRLATAERLREEVAAMSPDNFVVRAKRRYVERYAESGAWERLGPEALGEVDEHVAGLPSALADGDPEARMFDLLMLRLQLALLRTEPGFERLSVQVRSIVGLLEEKSAIPMVREHLELIQDMQADAWWQDVTAPMLENARKRIRALVKFIEKHSRKPVFTDFEDEIGEGVVVDLPGFGDEAQYERFRAKARDYLKAHTDHAAIRKLRGNEPLSPDDLTELERMLLAAGIGTSVEIERAIRESQGLGGFVRSLVGLDREAAKRAFDTFQQSRKLSANQLHFINMIIDYLTQNGVMDAGLLYESPFTDVSPLGLDGVFPGDAAEALLAVVEDIRKTTAPR